MSTLSSSGESKLATSLRIAVEESLGFFATSNAVFLSEMLVREAPTEESKHLLASSYYANGEIHRAYACLKNAKSTQNRYLLALCCFKLGKMQEAENALTIGGMCGEGTPSEAYSHSLLGQICRASSRSAQAIEHYMRALELQPALWSCYEGMCELGADVDPSKIFLERRMVPFNNGYATPCGQWSSCKSSSGTAEDSSWLVRRSDNAGSAESSSLLGMQTLAGALGACVGQGDNSPGSSTRSGSCISRPRTAGSESNKVPKLMVRQHDNAAWDAGTPRRSPRLQAHSPGSVREARRESEREEVRDEASDGRTRKQHGGPSGRHSSGEDSSSGAPAGRDESDGEADQAATGKVGGKSLFDVLRRLGDGYRHLHQFRGREAIAAFDKLSPSEGNNAWVQVQTATAYFNMAQYSMAEQAFKKARKLEPSRIVGMELYSTVLWFLKKEHELCYLAQELVALDRAAPQTWCVLGNCFSVQREFETAIKFFQRAIQVCPSFTYAYTLAGHEHVSNEDFEKATASFRNSLRADERHYNAWYGLAIIYLKQEKYQLAEYHLRRALAINPRNSVLYCYLGIVLLSAGSCVEALQVLQDAIDLDPSNPLAKLRKAMALSHLDRNSEALEELQELQQLAPREAMVYMQMGKILKKLGRLQEALACFNHAIDLDPKGGNAVKAQIDRLQVQDLEEDESFL